MLLQPLLRLCQVRKFKWHSTVWPGTARAQLVGNNLSASCLRSTVSFLPEVAALLLTTLAIAAISQLPHTLVEGDRFPS